MYYDVIFQKSYVETVFRFDTISEAGAFAYKLVSKQIPDDDRLGSVSIILTLEEEDDAE